jgi:hypothetical protein
MIDPDDVGQPRGDGESWGELCERLRGPRRRVHPLVLEVLD